MLNFFVQIPIVKQLGDFLSFSNEPNALGNLVTKFIDVIIILVVIASLIYLFFGGIALVTSGHDKSALETARNRIMGAFGGLALTLAAWALWVLIVKRFFGIEITEGINLGV